MRVLAVFLLGLMLALDPPGARSESTLWNQCLLVVASCASLLDDAEQGAANHLCGDGAECLRPVAEDLVTLLVVAWASAINSAAR